MATSPVRVFIIDDHTLLRETLRGVLQSDARFFVVGEAASARDALLALDEAAPDVVLMDINLPGEMDGVELTRFLKAIPVPFAIIGLSMHDSLEVKNAMREAGVTRFLNKNVSCSDLADAIWAEGIQAIQAMQPRS